MNNLPNDFEYYTSHQDELVNQFRGRWIVIKNQKVIGDYATEFEALQETKKEHTLGSFLIQFVDSGVSNYTQTFHSRVEL